MALAAADKQAENIKQRTDLTLGTSDTPMPSLKEKYRERKVKMGGKPVRDLRLTGQLMRDIKSRISRDYWYQVRGYGTTAEVYISTKRSNDVGEGNQKRAEWFGISAQDKLSIERVAEQIFDSLQL